MYSRFFNIIQILSLTALIAACSSTPKTEEPKTESRGPGGGMLIEASNAQLAKVPVVGFPPYTASMPIKQFDKYGENAATAAKAVVASLPEGYKLQITGHANANSGRSAAWVKNLSTQRAKFVQAYFVKKGLDGSKMIVNGAGDTEQDPGLSKEENRRVTFKLVEVK